jgi:predicted dehydrogenase
MAPIRVAVLGVGRWSGRAHIPAWRRDPRAEIVGIYDLDESRSRAASDALGGVRVFPSAADLIRSADVDAVDVVTWGPAHFEAAMSAIEAGKHVLCEKPVHRDYRETLRAHRAAQERGLRTKVGFTFRFSPAMMRVRELIEEGFLGRPLVFNGFEQNSQFLDPMTPIRVGEGDASDNPEIQVGSLEGYGAPIIDLARWFVGSELEEVVGMLSNLIPERMVPGSPVPVRLPIDDADCFIGRFRNGVMCTIQSSYVTIGNYPGLEARIYGTEGALVCRLVTEEGVCERLWGARKDAVEFKRLEIPDRLYPRSGSPTEPWETSFYSNLVANFISEIEDPNLPAGGDFSDAVAVQQVINAVEISYRQRGWVSLPLADPNEQTTDGA